jgi:hypothetical protein
MVPTDGSYWALTSIGTDHSRWKLDTNFHEPSHNPMEVTEEAGGGEVHGG